MKKKTRWSRAGAKLSTGGQKGQSPTLAGKTDWYETGGDREFTMNIRNPEDVGLAKPEKNVEYACKVGFCSVDTATGKPIVFKTSAKSGATKWLLRQGHGMGKTNLKRFRGDRRKKN